MKKGVIVGVIVVVSGIGGWLFAREHFARANADQYLSAREIPTYHALSLHGRDDLTVVGGFCRPCGVKARAVLEERVDKEVDESKRKLDSILSGGRR